VASRFWLHLNVRAQPKARQADFEDDLEVVLRRFHPGISVTGGGTLLSPVGEPLSCDVDFEVEGGDAATAMRRATVLLAAAGVGKGSRAQLENGESMPFGDTEGLAIYLNGTGLPNEVYQDDPNELVAALREALGTEFHRYYHWHGPSETALYLYGASAVRMRELAAGPLSRFRLAQRCRIVDLPLELPAR
jgi:hypothetical protein